jgi:hypothetical protein
MGTHATKWPTAPVALIVEFKISGPTWPGDSQAGGTAGC